MADWLRGRPARLFNTGYAANLGVMSALADARDVILSDELNHASLIDGCRLARAQVVVIPHGDLAALEARAARRAPARRRFVVSESLFSMDGDIADVAALAAVCARHDAALILDEAHAIGARGPEGRGVAAAVGVVPAVVIGTFGKALGTSGAFVASGPRSSRSCCGIARGRSCFRRRCLHRPPLRAARRSRSCAASRAATGAGRCARMHGGCARRSPPSVAALMEPSRRCVIGDDRRGDGAERAMLERRVFAQGIRPPTVPEKTARLRVSVSRWRTRTQPPIDRG